MVDRVAETLRLGTWLVDVVEAEAEGFEILASGLVRGLLIWPVDRVFDTGFGCTVVAFMSRYFLVVGLKGPVKLNTSLESNRRHCGDK